MSSKHAALLTALCVGLIATPAYAGQCEGVTLPDKRRLGDTDLVLNGMGVREATMLKIDVYIAGLYVESRSSDPEELLDPKKPKQLILRLVRDVDRDEMVEALTAGFRKNAGDEMPQLRDRMRRFASWIPELEEGDVLIFTNFPGKGVQVMIGDRVAGTIEGDDFSRVFFAIWLGSSPPNPGLRRGLLGGECG